MPLPLSFEFLLDPAETVRAGQHVQKRQRFAWVGWAMWPLFAILAIVHLSVGGRLEELQLLGSVALVVGLGQLLGPRIQRRRYRRLYAETPATRGPQVYRFDADGLMMTGGVAAITLGWNAIVEADETDELFLFFFNKQGAYYLPKRAIGGAPVESELRELLRTHLGDRAHKLRDHSRK
jgi:hypothetical protein